MSSIQLKDLELAVELLDQARTRASAARFLVVRALEYCEAMEQADGMLHWAKFKNERELLEEFKDYLLHKLRGDL